MKSLIHTTVLILACAASALAKPRTIITVDLYDLSIGTYGFGFGSGLSAENLIPESKLYKNNLIKLIYREHPYSWYDGTAVQLVNAMIGRTFFDEYGFGNIYSGLSILNCNEKFYIGLPLEYEGGVTLAEYFRFKLKIIANLNTLENSFAFSTSACIRLWNHEE